MFGKFGDRRRRDCRVTTAAAVAVIIIIIMITKLSISNAMQYAKIITVESMISYLLSLRDNNTNWIKEITNVTHNQNKQTKHSWWKLTTHLGYHNRTNVTVSYLAVLMYPILFNVCTVKLLSLTLYVNWEFVTESKSVAVTVHKTYTQMRYILCLRKHPTSVLL